MTVWCCVQDLLQETQIGQKELMRAIQSLALGKSQQRVLIWRNRRPDSGSKDFSTFIEYNDNGHLSILLYWEVVLYWEVKGREYIRTLTLIWYPLLGGKVNNTVYLKTLGRLLGGWKLVLTLEVISIMSCIEHCIISCAYLLMYMLVTVVHS